MAISIRPAELSDVNQIVNFNCRLALESEGIQLKDQLVTAGVKAIIADPDRGRYWLAERDGAVCGQCLVTVEPSDWNAASYWWLQSVYVDSSHRRSGVFRALWHSVLDAATAAGDVAAVRLYVDQENRDAREAYQRMGMRKSGYLVYELPIGRT
jgi:ribosomal protein S18 acetylase RimI-like enzyme